MIKIHARELFQDLEDILNIEVLLVGDHGKGEMISVAVFIMRFITENKNTKIIGLQI